MNIAVVLAAGSGTRTGLETPKQFVMANGKLLVEYSLATFQAHPDIDEIAVVTSEAYIQQIEQLKEKGLYSKLNKILLGGTERYQSSWAAIQAFSDRPDDVLLIHDAARPLLSPSIISDVVESMRLHNAAVVAVPASDTVLHSFDNKRIADIPPRKEMYYAQTPQAFRVKTIQRAFELGIQDTCFNPTDDSGVLLRYLPEEPIVIVEGESVNRKITFKDDLLWFTSQIAND